MTRKILINGRREEELRVAIVENQTLEDFEIETKRRGVIRNNIYRAVVTNIAPSLNAAFVDFGDSRNGFLAFNDVVEGVYSKPVRDSYRISDVLTVGQELIVQVIKDASALKGAQVTTNISLAGRYLVLRPRDAKSGVSHKLDDDARADLTQKIRSLDLPDGYGCIVRTNAMDQSRAILLRDAKVLVQLWHKIEAEFARGKGPQLLYNDQDIVVQAMRDYYDSSINEVIIDDKCCYERALAYVRATIASGEDKLKFYDDKMPLFTRYGIERQIEQIYARTVRLPSGGFIVIDPTEALTAIDVNSAHSTKRESQDQTAYSTNLEAAVEIGRQLRMRDIGGLIVIDFIDMRQGKYQRDVERVMRNALSRDKARCKVERISANGLLEINRQRISQALSQRTHLECPTCGGRGFIPSADAIGMTLIREIDAHAVDGKLGGVIIKLHPDIAQQLQNEMRREFAQLELDYGIRIEIVASREVTRGAEEIEWLSKSQAEELHPELVSVPAQDAASIVDVAEAYQASESEDGGYRPNDFEEFSSDEARKKRAAKRAARREAEMKGVQADAVSKCEAENVSRGERGKSEKGNKPDTGRAARRDQVEAKADQPDMDARDGIGISLLGLFVGEMKNRMEVSRPSGEEKPGRRRPSFRARRKSNSGEKLSLQSDMRLFVMDILHAVCVLACGCDRDVPRREMLSRMDEVSDWLLDAGQLPKAECHKRVIALRNQISSRHACARMNCLFDVRGHARPDELARFLLDACKSVGTFEVTDESIAALSAWFSERCARIFGECVEQDNARRVDDACEVADTRDGVSEPRGEEDAGAALNIDAAFLDAVEQMAQEEIEEAFRETAQAEVPEVAASVEMSEDVRENGRRRRRSHRRHAMGEASDQPLVEDGQLVISDVEISPMTVAEPETADEMLGMAITQELPAVAPRRQRRSHRRSEMNEGGERKDAAVENAEGRPEAAEKPAESAEISEVSADAVKAQPAEMSEDKLDRRLLAQMREGGQVSTRRVRHTRRIPADIVKQAYDISASEVSMQAEPEHAVEAEKAEAMISDVEDVAPVLDVPEVVDAPVASEDIARSGRSRRSRRTTRAGIGGAVSESAEVASHPAEVASQPASVAEPEQPTANAVEDVKTVAVESVAVEAVSESAAVEAVEASEKPERRRNRRGEKASEREDKEPRERRERSTRARKPRKDVSVQEDAGNSGEAVAVAAEAPVSESDHSVVAADEQPVAEEAPRRSRRVRRTRVSAETSAEEIQPVASAEPARVIEAERQVESEQEQAVKMDAERAEAPKQRAVRRTRRTRREDAESVADVPVAPVQEAPVETPKSVMTDAQPVEAVSEVAEADHEPVARTRARRTRRARPEEG